MFKRSARSLLYFSLLVALLLAVLYNFGAPTIHAQEPSETTEPVQRPPEPAITPTIEPTASPNSEPTEEPPPEPTEPPTAEPSDEPEAPPATEPEPTDEPTPAATAEPSPSATPEPSLEPTKEATATPVNQPEPEPTIEPISTSTAEPAITEPPPAPPVEPEPTGERPIELTEEPPVELATTTILGQVSLAGSLGNDSSGAVVSLSQTNTPPEVLSVTTNEVGNFEIFDVPTNAEVTVIADADGYLPAVCARITPTAPETRLLPTSLVSGDVNEDDRVDISDVAMIAVGFGRTGPELLTDVNQDEVVDIFDIVLVSKNFGKEGPLDWICQ